MSPAALALALLLGHEARITSEQWSEVRAMDNLCAICGVAPRNPLANVCQSCSDKVEQTREQLISERQITHHCPNCEAAARELADLRERIEALAREMETDDRAGKLAHWIISLRKIAEKEAK